MENLSLKSGDKLFESDKYLLYGQFLFKEVEGGSCGFFVPIETSSDIEFLYNKVEKLKSHFQDIFVCKYGQAIDISRQHTTTTVVDNEEKVYKTGKLLRAQEDLRRQIKKEEEETIRRSTLSAKATIPSTSEYKESKIEALDIRKGLMKRKMEELSSYKAKVKELELSISSLANEITLFEEHIATL